MPNLYYWQEVLMALRRIIRATDMQSKRMERSSGLTIPQVIVLSAIAKLGTATVRRISEEVSLSQATVTTILNRLEERGLLSKIRNDLDRRAVDTSLTEAGRQALANAPPLLHERFIARFEALHDWEKTQILSALQRVATMMDADQLDAAPLLDIAAPTEDRH
ncbi:MAG TPA: MarR family transcriptional regulator [Spongiibacteraceae bacterium]|jgi:DNA-binding MarR family transcriptional regulator|nr:MarR family transcriptional regulator [Spongiibacteraceae bacterium]HUH38078.1 MarR family transcriptional regulator [Spongiibacteraceae bacterium]